VFQEHDAKYLNVKYRYKDERGQYRLSDLTAAGVRHGDSGLPWRGFDPTPLGRHWGVPTIRVAGADDLDISGLTTQEKLDRLDEHGYIYWTPGSGSRPGFPQFKRYLTQGLNIQDVITDIPPINSMARERLGYPTQKPVALLERIVAASSNPGDIVLDPFCGCGTAVHAAQKLGRPWLGIDITHLAIGLIERRLRDAFPRITFDVIGTPKDIGGARDLAARDRYQFQWWAVSLVNAQPYGGKKKGADTGIDGKIYFKPDGKRTDVAIVSVKSGGVSVNMIRELKSVIEREKAPMGLFLTLDPPTGPMRVEATAAGFYETTWGKHPRIQILTIGELLDGKRPDMPLVDVAAAFRPAPRENQEGEQHELTV
jgi:site-specific DNA-methyltransferase (adenine-specific)